MRTSGSLGPKSYFYFNFGAAETPRAQPQNEKAGHFACLVALRLVIGITEQRLYSRLLVASAVCPSLWQQKNIFFFYFGVGVTTLTILQEEPERRVTPANLLVVIQFCLGSP